jgi:hypothetical protein
MSFEIEELPLAEQFEQLIQSGDKLSIAEFLNDQNISDVAELMNFPITKRKSLPIWPFTALPVCLRYLI